jgi:hypothetical protein
MNCHECSVSGRTEAAVGICRHCQLGLCATHLREAATYTQGGMHYACPHRIPTAGAPIGRRG